ncbi:MAG TPA: hypothetical protein VGA37_08140 [Gemmatimonadales bacterium]
MHCTMDEMLAVRDGEGSARAKAHVEQCERCQVEMDLIARRAAALRALPVRRPPRDRWLVVRGQALAERRHARLARFGWGSVAVAAGLALAVGLRGVEFSGRDDRPAALVAEAAAGSAIDDLVAQSQQLEAALRAYGPDGRVMSGRAASLVAELEDRIALVDQGIARVRAVNGSREQLVNLWRDRVLLMEGLVNTHVTRASYVGF